MIYFIYDRVGEMSMKKKGLLLYFLVLMFIFTKSVDAIEYSSVSCHYFNDKGEVSSSGNRDCVKKFDGKYVYCMQWAIQMGDGTRYKKDSSWEKKSARAIKAGLMIDFIYENETKLSDVKKYSLASATLNAFNARSKKWTFGKRG